MVIHDTGKTALLIFEDKRSVVITAVSVLLVSSAVTPACKNFKVIIDLQPRAVLSLFTSITIRLNHEKNLNAQSFEFCY